MPTTVLQPADLTAAGSPPNSIEEFFGLAQSGRETVSMARMVSPQGWSESGQSPQFREYTLVLHGCLVVETRSDCYRITAGQAIATEAGEWVRYSTPEPEGAEYIAVCLPAFSPMSAHRDA